MRVIEIAHIEGDPVPVVTLDGVPLGPSTSVTPHFAYNAPTKIFISGVRVTEPTRVVKHGVVVAQDNADTEVAISVREAPRTWMHHPQCRTVAQPSSYYGEGSACMGALSGCYLS